MPLLLCLPLHNQFIIAAMVLHVASVLSNLSTENAKYVFPKRFESRNLKEALMFVPDLETAEFKVLKREEEYEI
ncbi:hypothetical protein MRB53_035801 [Persea americana]|uniref:Uncharacterized protein n=1 Tax=Persea americana TaxID=3435 RepID=A0ACC2K5N2_PERAE|nr:hypothetical protein MRB53_035801 [Persea americana]